MDKIKYPIGKYRAKKGATPRDIARWIDEIEQLPNVLENLVLSLSDEQLNTSYRENGWNLRQVVHHIADSHLNGYTRIKLALTENQPTIKPYEQDPWSKLEDMSLPIEPSLDIIRGLHQRWAHLLKSLNEDQLTQEVIHPEEGILTVKSLIGLYAWHGKHHFQHIKSLKERKNWT